MARERGARLEHQLRQRDAAAEEQAREVRRLRAQLAASACGGHGGSPQYQHSEALAASNARLQRELEGARAQVRRLQLEAAVEGETATAVAAAPAAATLHLRQQLAAANHRAARLQIELEAAAEKLRIYEEAGGGGGGIGGPRLQPQSAPRQQQSVQQHAWQAAAQQGRRAAHVEQWLHAAHG